MSGAALFRVIGPYCHVAYQYRAVYLPSHLFPEGGAGEYHGAHRHAYRGGRHGRHDTCTGGRDGIQAGGDGQAGRVRFPCPDSEPPLERLARNRPRDGGYCAHGIRRPSAALRLRGPLCREGGDDKDAGSDTGRGAERYRSRLRYRFPAGTSCRRFASCRGRGGTE